MNTFYGTVYTTLMKTKYLMTTTIVGSLVCVIATAGLIPVLGLYGAGAASILCNAVIYVMRMINSRRLVSIDVNYCILVISIVLLGVQMMITAMAVPYYWVYGVLIFLVLTRYAMCAFAAACCRQEKQVGRKPCRAQPRMPYSSNAILRTM